MIIVALRTLFASETEAAELHGTNHAIVDVYIAMLMALSILDVISKLL